MQEVWGWVALGSAVLFVASLVLLPLAVIRLPQDYLTRSRRRALADSRRPVLLASARVLKNLLGGLFVVGGVIMLLTPGQGLLSIVVGVALLDIPGKHRLVARLLCNRRVSGTLDGIRRWAGRPPLDKPQQA